MQYVLKTYCYFFLRESSRRTANKKEENVMTKTFWFDQKHPMDLDEEFFEFFDENTEEIFTSWLVHSFEIIVMNKTINSIRCTVKEGVATFDIWWHDDMVYPAGEAKVNCASELLSEFFIRLYSPEKYRA